MAATGHNIVIAIGYTKRVTRGMTHMIGVEWVKCLIR